MDQVDGAPVLEDSGPLPSQRSRPSLGLFFQNSEESPSEWTEEPLEQAGEASSPLGDGSPSASASPSDEEPGWSDEAPSSSPSASDPASKKPLSNKALKPMFRQGVQIGSGMAYRFAARTAGQQQVGLYLADDEDAANIADPLASIAARREGIAGKVSPDTADFISSMMGVAGYLSKQMVRAQAAAQIDSGSVPSVDPDGQP
jgi:hypothetical protein